MPLALTCLFRGPNHTVRHRPRYHDYWCELTPDGLVPYGFISQQCCMAAALIQKEVDGIRGVVVKFSTGVERILALLPKLAGVAMSLKSGPELSIPLPSSSVSSATLPHRFNPQTVSEVLHQPREEAEDIGLGVRGEIRQLCQKLRFLRVLHQLARQNLHGKCSGAILSSLGAASYLPEAGLVSFTFEEVKVPTPDLISSPMASIEDEVIQHIEHWEPAAEREPELATTQAHQEWADLVVAQIQADVRDGCIVQEHAQDAQAEERVYLLQYKRHSEKFRQALTTGKALESCRHALDTAGFQWLQPSGAKIFVHPWQFQPTMDMILKENLELRPYHVIVSESLEYYVEASLSDVPCRDGARVKDRKVLESAGYTGGDGPHAGEDEPQPHPAADDDGVAMDLAPIRTFLCFLPRLRASKSVTQSTTEVHGGGVNPRRFQAASISEEG